MSDLLGKPFTYFISHQHNTTLVLAVTDHGALTYTNNKDKNGWEGWQLEDAGNGVHFITSRKHPEYVLAVDDQGNLTITNNRIANGWEGWRIEYRGGDNYKIYSNLSHNRVLSYSDERGLYTSHNDEDCWHFELAPFVGFVVSNSKQRVLAINDEGNVVTTTNKMANGWEGLRFEHGPGRIVFISSNKDPNRVLAINSEDGSVLTTQNRMAGGWEGIDIQNAGRGHEGVFFLSSHVQHKHVLAVDDNGNVLTTSNRHAKGWEGWTIEEGLNV